MKKIKVLEVLPSIQEGGVEHFLYNYLSKFDMEKFEIDFLTQNPRYFNSEEKFKKLNITIYSIPSKKQNIFKYFINSYKIMKKNKYDIVHVHVSAKSFWMLFIAKIVGVKNRICHSHEARNLTGVKKNIYKLYSFLSIKFATKFYACGENAKQFVFGERNDVEIIPNSIDIDSFSFNEEIRKNKRKEFGIKNDTLVFGHIGRFVEQKNHNFLIDVFNEIHKETSNSLLLLVGEGPLMNEIKEKINNLNLTNSVKFLRQRNDVNELYQLFDVFLLPSLYEGFPVTGIEAQASGLPCYFSNSISDEILITNTSYMISISNIDCWKGIIFNKNTNEERIKKGKELKKTIYFIDNSVSKLESLYINLIE